MHLEDILYHHGIDVASFSQPDYQRAEKEYPIFLLHVPSAHVLRQWEILRTLVPETGY